MRMGLSLLNKVIWFCGVLTLLYFFLWLIMGSELKNIRKELKADNQVNAYAFSWYEGEALSSHIWLSGDGYMKMDYLDREDFSEAAVGLIWNVGDQRVSCTSSNSKDDKLVYNKTRGMAISKIADVVGLSDQERTLHDVFRHYKKLSVEIAKWPSSPNGHKDSDGAGYYENDDIVFQCWKTDMSAPEIPFYGGLEVIDGGFNFYRKPD